MSKHLISYTKLYIAPKSQSDTSILARRMDSMVRICSETILNHIISQKESTCSIQHILVHYFPESFLKKYANHTPQFIDIELLIASFACEYNSRTKAECFENILVISEQCSPLIECLILRIVELYFLAGESFDQLWKEIYQDDELKHIAYRFYINELCFIPESAHDFLKTYDVSTNCRKAVVELIDSYTVALIRSDEGKKWNSRPPQKT